jgi:hypothetical protein
MKIKTIPILMLLSGLLGSIVATAARPHQQEKADQLSEAEALGLLRTINTTQIVFYINTDPRHFASLKELSALIDENSRTSGFSNPAKDLELADSSTGRLKNYTVSVFASADGQHYISGLISSSGCASAFFSSERGVIYTATGLGCAHEKASNNN